MMNHGVRQPVTSQQYFLATVDEVIETAIPESYWEPLRRKVVRMNSHGKQAKTKCSQQHYPEADTSYRVTCTGKGITNVPVVIATTNASASQFTITIAAITAAAATFSSYDCVAGHN